jgi:hypothetical protein
MQQLLEPIRQFATRLGFKYEVRRKVRAMLAPLSINAMREVLELGGYHDLQPGLQVSAVDAAFNVVAQGLPRALGVLKPDATSLAAFGLNAASTPDDIVAAIRRLTDKVVEAGGTKAQADLLFHRIHCTLTGVPIEDLAECAEKRGAEAAAAAGGTPA